MFFCQHYFFSSHLLSALDHLCLELSFAYKLLIVEFTAAKCVAVTEGSVRHSSIVYIVSSVALVGACFAHAEAPFQPACPALIPVHLHSHFSIERVQTHTFFNHRLLVSQSLFIVGARSA